MIKNLLKWLLMALFSFCTYHAMAQSAIDDKVKPDDKTSGTTSSFKVDITYASNNVFMGRTDTTKTPVLIPEIKYTLKCGLYFSGSLDIIPNRRKKKLDGGSLTAGYDFDITDDLSGGVSVAKLFYSAASTQLSSSIRETFNANLTYDIAEIISPAVSIDYNLNKQGIGNDVFLNLGLGHDFAFVGIFDDADLILVSPTVAANTGTENFYNAYLTEKKLKNAKRATAQTALLDEYTSQLGKFKLLDYELSAPFEYKNGGFIFHFTPTYAIVKNELPKQITAKLSDASSVFYFETGAAYKF